MGELPCPCLECKRCTGESSVVSESCDSAAFIIGEEFEIKEGSAATRETGEDLLPSGLLLVAVCELNMDVLERDCNYQLLSFVFIEGRLLSLQSSTGSSFNPMII